MAEPKIEHSYAKELNNVDQRLLNLMDVILHASQCKTERCEVKYCPHVIIVLNHMKTCPQITTGGCKDCGKVSQLCQSHADSCSDLSCMVPFCTSMQTQQEREPSDEVKYQIEVLAHAYDCDRDGCTYPQCKNLTQVLKHKRNCIQKKSGKCATCTYIMRLEVYHAQRCSDDACTFQFCPAMKSSLREVDTVMTLARMSTQAEGQ